MPSPVAVGHSLSKVPALMGLTGQPRSEDGTARMIAQDQEAPIFRVTVAREAKLSWCQQPLTPVRMNGCLEVGSESTGQDCSWGDCSSQQLLLTQ